jgi:hypothetical protein
MLLRSGTRSKRNWEKELTASSTNALRATGVTVAIKKIRLEHADEGIPGTVIRSKATSATNFA